LVRDGRQGNVNLHPRVFTRGSISADGDCEREILIRNRLRFGDSDRSASWWIRFRLVEGKCGLSKIRSNPPASRAIGLETLREFATPGGIRVMAGFSLRGLQVKIEARVFLRS
jgi:hypothetical protein